MRPKGKSLKQVGQEWINFHFCLVGQSNINTFSFSGIFWEAFPLQLLSQCIALQWLLIIVRDKNLRKCEIVWSFSYYGGGQFSFMVIVTFFIWNELPLVESLKDPTLQLFPQVLDFFFTKPFGNICCRRTQFEWKYHIISPFRTVKSSKYEKYQLKEGTISAQCRII